MITDDALRAAAKEASLALAETLVQGSKQQPPYSPSKSFTRKMSRLCRRERHPVFHRTMQRVAAVFLALLLTGIGWRTIDDGVEEQERHTDALRSSWYYVSGSDFIFIEVDVYNSGTVLSLIGDHSGYEEVHVNQFTALFVPADGNSGISNLVWIDEQNWLMFSVGSTLEKSVMLHIAESIELLQSPN